MVMALVLFGLIGNLPARGYFLQDRGVLCLLLQPCASLRRLNEDASQGRHDASADALAAPTLDLTG